jgi:glycosyltransferase involved in cell wall biosynthesis
MKRILFVHEMAEISGIENVLSDIMLNLDPARFEPIVACPSGPYVKRLQEQHISHIPFTFRLLGLKTRLPGTSIRLINPVALLQKVFEGVWLARLIRKYRIDIIHTNSLSSNIAGLIAARLTGKPIIWHIHLYMMRMLFQFMLPDRIVFVSNAVLKNAFPSSAPQQARVIYNTQSLIKPDSPSRTYHDIRAEFNISADQPLAGMVGTVDPIKGIDSVLKAWALVVKNVPDARLLHVGKIATARGSAYMEELNSLIQDSGIDNSVQFAGFRSDVEDVLRALDVYVNFTMNEAHSPGALEAMAAALPIIGANSGGMPEIVLPGETGLLVDNSDIEGLANAISTLLRDPERSQQMGRAGRKRVFSEFALETFIREMQHLYEEL